MATESTFLLGFRPEEQVRRVVQYALASGALVRPEPALPEPAAGDQDAPSETLPLGQPALDQPALAQPPLGLRAPRIAGPKNPIPVSRLMARAFLRSLMASKRRPLARSTSAT